MLYNQVSNLFHFAIKHQKMGSRQSEPETQVDVDLRRYEGTWFEIAKYPFYWEPPGSRKTTAKYTLVSEAKVDILNCQFLSNGTKVCSKGTARPTDHTHAKLKVKFERPPDGDVKWAGPLAALEGDYWILETDYKTYSLVGHPQRKFLWILSRAPTMGAYEYGVLLATLKHKFGYDTRKLVVTPQT